MLSVASVGALDDWLLSIALCGVAAAFGAPMGGVLFSFEEASTHWSMVHTLRTFFCAMVSTKITSSLASSCLLKLLRTR